MVIFGFLINIFNALTKVINHFFTFSSYNCQNYICKKCTIGLTEMVRGHTVFITVMCIILYIILIILDLWAVM